MDEIEELKQFKEKIEREGARRIVSNKLGYMITSFILAAIFFYSSYLMNSLVSQFKERPLIPQMISIFYVIAIISSIIFVILLTHLTILLIQLIITKIKKRKSIQP